MPTINKNQKPLWAILVGLVFVTGFLFAYPDSLFAQSSDDEEAEDSSSDTSTSLDWEEGAHDEEVLEKINREIDAKRAAIDELKERTEHYEQNIKIKQQEALSLRNQLLILDLQVEQTELDIERVNEEIDAVNLELDYLALALEDKEAEIADAQEILATYLRLLNQYGNRTHLEVFIANDSFSDFFDQMQYTENLEGQVEEAMVALRDAKEELVEKETLQKQKKTELDELSETLSSTISNLNDQREYKENLLVETKESEVKFGELLEQAKKEQQAAESEIQTLESKARERLQEEGIDLNVDAVLMWPVNPLRGISAYFHDPTYPFRNLFEHPAIDVPTPQGTAIRAAENGYVVRAKNAGLGYSYVMIVHTNELSTVYGHISRIDVAEDEYVVRGQQIGLSGGLPGTPGAGRLSTGAHLHFEVRYDGIPVNPLDYLPAL